MVEIFTNEVFLRNLSYLNSRIDEIHEKNPLNFSEEIADFIKDTLLLNMQLIPYHDINFFSENYSSQLSNLERTLKQDPRQNRQELLFRLISDAQDNSLRHKLKLALHGERTGLYAKVIALDLGVDPREIQIAGRYHDLGKLQVPSDVLLKETKLTQDEWQYIFEHPVWSERILTPFYHHNNRILEAVKYHHEDWSGQGYPEGISGFDIPVFARILRVADSFDSMTSERPFSRKKSFDEAVEEIEKNESGFYDPQISRRMRVLRKIYDFFHKAA
ncbi:hypothetical protein DRN73_03440 [Candidatus Pacearchaeota archaeon]|nr:MAG: hypothetical protein DRN73_03440 [Candidatus Pacearchaeota archaeon]